MGIILKPRNNMNNIETDWIEIVNFTTGHTSYTDEALGFLPVAYKRIGNVVYFRGAVRKNSTNGFVMFNVTQYGIRPNRRINFHLVFNTDVNAEDLSSEHEAYLNTNGDFVFVNVAGLDDDIISLDNVIYVL